MMTICARGSRGRVECRPRAGRRAALALFGALGLALAAACPVPAGEATYGAPAAKVDPKSEAKGSGPAAHEAASDSQEASILDTLPQKFRKADGSVDQDVLVAHQKKRVDLVNKSLHTRLRVTETPHFLVCSDTDVSVTSQFVKWCEALYANMGGLFGIGATERIWDGKCMLILFARRPKFEEFSNRLDQHDAGKAGAYFAIENYGDKEPALLKICIPMDDKEPRYLQELFAHEGTHAFFEMYRKRGLVPLWLHEGLAEYMTTVNDPSLRGPLVSAAARMAQVAGPPVRRLLAAKPGTNLSLDEYAVAFSMVDFLIVSGKPKFKKFVDLLKDGKDQEAALREAYGWTQRDLEKRWRAAAQDASKPR
jgi:hypothetical protein